MVKVHPITYTKQFRCIEISIVTVIFFHGFWDCLCLWILSCSKKSRFTDIPRVSNPHCRLFFFSPSYLCLTSPSTWLWLWPHLGVLEKTWTVTACLHRFCSNCLHKSLRMQLGNFAYCFPIRCLRNTFPYFSQLHPSPLSLSFFTDNSFGQLTFLPILSTPIYSIRKYTTFVLSSNDINRCDSYSS